MAEIDLDDKEAKTQKPQRSPDELRCLLEQAEKRIRDIKQEKKAKMKDFRERLQEEEAIITGVLQQLQ